MSEIEETSKVINDDIGSWYFGYTLLKSTKLDITNYRIFKLTSWIKKRNQINEIIKKGKSIIIAKNEIDIALILGLETDVTNEEKSEDIDNSFSYIQINNTPEYLYGTTHRPGLKNDKELADDLIIGDKSESYFNNIKDKKGKDIDFSSILKHKTEPDKLFKIMKSNLNNFSMFELDDVLSEWIDFFKRKVLVSYGQDFTFRKKENSNLTQKIKEHEKTKDMIKRIKDILEKELTKKDVKGDIYQLLLEIKKNKNNAFYKELHWGTNLENDRTPNYSTNTDSLMGLRILINDVWGYDIEIEKYKIEDSEISGTLIIKFFDNFGLDDDDISKFGNKLNGDGFKAWYFIQHYNGFTKVEGFGKTCYQPFITQATVKEEFCFKYE